MVQKKIDIVTWLKNWFQTTANMVTSWSGTTSNSKYPSEKLVKDSLDGKSNTGHGHALNDIENDANSQTLDVTLYDMNTAISGKASSTHTHGNLSNDGKVGTASGKIITTTTGGAIQASDSITKSQISDFPSTMTPSSHTHGSITNDGKVGTHANYIVTTGTNGAITTSQYITDRQVYFTNEQGAPQNTLYIALGNKANNNHNQASSTITDSNTYVNIENAAQTQASINSAIDTKLGTINTAIASAGAVTLTKETTANTGYLATYTFAQNGVSIGQIDIPKDFLVKSGSIKTVTTADSPVSGYMVGDKYIDLVINTKDSSGTDEHLYIKTTDLVEDTQYSADESTLTAYTSNGENKFKIKDGGITVTQLNSTLQAHLVDINSIRLGPTTGTDAGCIIFDSITDPYTTYS